MNASASCVRKLLLRQTLNEKKRSESLGAFYTNTRTPCGSSRQKNCGAHQIQANPVRESYTRLRSAQGSSAGFGNPEHGSLMLISIPELSFGQAGWTSTNSLWICSMWK